jgi:hypothetical protein
MGVTPDEIPTGMPHIKSGWATSIKTLVGALQCNAPTTTQMFDALSYYCDNRDAIDDYIERNKIPEELIHPLLKNS